MCTRPVTRSRARFIRWSGRRCRLPGTTCATCCSRWAASSRFVVTTFFPLDSHPRCPGQNRGGRPLLGGDGAGQRSGDDRGEEPLRLAAPTTTVVSADAEENEHVLSTPPYWAPSVVGPAFLRDTKHRFSGAHGSGRGAPRATAGAEASCAEEAIERPRPDEAGSRPGDCLMPVGARGIVASWRRRTRACLRAGRCVMKHVARAFLLAAVVLTLGGHRDALAGGCKPDGRTCRTNQSCCSRLCAKAPTAKFGMCCTPNCTGKACGDDGCGGSCGECSCGTLLLTWGVPGGTGNGELRRPGDAATDASGNIYVADADNHRIQKFDASGTFLTAWGSSGALGVATDGAGNVYVTEDTRVQKFACP